MKLDNIHIIYFIGIGGIGMSALARYFKKIGCDVHGYDRVDSRITQELKEEGMHIHFQDDIQMIPENVDLVVYTPAVPESHAELTWFRINGYEVKKRAEVLGIISKSKKTIAVAGTHGKTTTTSIITHILRTGGMDCTAFLGGIANDYNSNFVFGQSEWVVVEADEFDRSFLHLSPYYSVVTSTDADHLDIYGNHEEMLRSFSEFVANTQPKGKAFLREGIRLTFNEKEMASLENVLKEDAYGLGEGMNQAQNIRVENGFFVFDFKGEMEIKDIRFTLPGRHNIENATAAISIALDLGISPEKIKEALATFKGIWRRFEFVVREKDFVYIDDYAHHPSELRAAIGAAKELYPNEKITGVFQPHLYSRTRDFAKGFSASLDQLDQLFLMDIYPARELPIEGVTSDMILEGMESLNKKRVSKENLLQELKLSEPKVLLTLGAGDIDRFIVPIKQLFTY